MTRIVVDADLLRKLHDLKEPLEFADDSGRLLGKFVPAGLEHRPGYLEPQISREEIERRKQNKGKTYTTTEVLKYLENL